VNTNHSKVNFLNPFDANLIFEKVHSMTLGKEEKQTLYLSLFYLNLVWISQTYRRKEV